jgi:hypothetical protein
MFERDAGFLAQPQAVGVLGNIIDPQPHSNRIKINIA